MGYVIELKTYDDGEVGFDIQDILKGTTTRLSTVKYYNLETFEDKQLIVTLYNKNKRKIKLRMKKCTN